MLLNTLKELIQEDPLRNHVDLSAKQISVVDNNSVDVLSRFKNMRTLNLSDNYLQKLPANMELLKELQELNLNGNPIEDIELAVDAIKTMGQNLKCLQINLFEEDQVDYLLRNIPWLEDLNGLTVERDALFNEDSSDQEQEQENEQHIVDQMDHDRNTRLYEEILNDSQMFEKDELMNSAQRDNDPPMLINQQSQQHYGSTQQKINQRYSQTQDDHHKSHNSSNPVPLNEAPTPVQFDLTRENQFHGGDMSSQGSNTITHDMRQVEDNKIGRGKNIVSDVTSMTANLVETSKVNSYALSSNGVLMTRGNSIPPSRLPAGEESAEDLTMLSANYYQNVPSSLQPEIEDIIADQPQAHNTIDVKLSGGRLLPLENKYSPILQSLGRRQTQESGQPLGLHARNRSNTSNRKPSSGGGSMIGTGAINRSYTFNSNTRNTAQHSQSRKSQERKQEPYVSKRNPLQQIAGLQQIQEGRHSVRSKSGQSRKSDKSNRNSSQGKSLGPRKQLVLDTQKQLGLIEDLTTPQYSNQIAPNVVNLDIQQFANSTPLSPQLQQLQAYIDENVQSLEPLGILTPVNVDEIELNQVDLESIAIIYDWIREIHKRLVLHQQMDRENHNIGDIDIIQEAADLAKDEDKRLGEEFDSHLNISMQTLNVKLREVQGQQTLVESSQLPPAMMQQIQQHHHQQKQSYILWTKQSLVHLCLQKTQEFTRKQTIQGLSEEVFTLPVAQIMQNLINFQQQIDEKIFSICFQQQVMIHNQNTMNQNLNQADTDKKELQASNELKDLEIRELQIKLQEKDQEISRLQKAKSTGSLQQTKAFGTSMSDLKKQRDQQLQQYSQKKSQPHFAVQQPVQSHAQEVVLGKQQISNSHSSKILPLKQLKDVITDMYSQKVKYDQKCRDSQLPIETMEQFMYTYLNQKYGLKTLIIEWASTIIAGVKTYLRDDHEITLFAKILKNECDEDFRYVQMHVKDQLLQMLKQIQRERYPTKSESEINKECLEIQNTQIEEWMWKKVVHRMYEANDGASLISRFNQILWKKKQQNHNFKLKENKNSQNTLNSRNDNGGLGKYISHNTRSKSKQRLTRNEEIVQARKSKMISKLNYQKEFLKEILDFQLEEHERFLAEFNTLFKRVDLDKNGIIDENQFIQLIMDMNVVVQNHHDATKDINSLLRVIDPHNNHQMTYSEVVQLLSNQLVPTQQMMQQKYLQQPLMDSTQVEFGQMFVAQDSDQESQEMPREQSHGTIKLVPILEKFFNHQTGNQDVASARTDAQWAQQPEQYVQQQHFGPTDLDPSPAIGEDSQHQSHQLSNRQLISNMNIGNLNERRSNGFDLLQVYQPTDDSSQELMMPASLGDDRLNLLQQQQY